ncbi:MAG: damage-inducible protein DinB [Symploca sp. SIO3C6]|nr:damage-inducible protein DinB [Symploca sp. SIO3C6]
MSSKLEHLQLNPLIAHFRILAQYNRLVNCRLYEVCAKLCDRDLRFAAALRDRKQTRPAFFKSIHGTLNHIMVGDRIWLTRFEGKQIPSTRLDAILYENFDELWAVRVSEDTRIEEFIWSIEESFLFQTIRYQNNRGNIHNDPVTLLLAHFFNHQTHHRGQIHDMLTQTEVAPPVLDMHRVICPDPENI